MSEHVLQQNESKSKVWLCADLNLAASGCCRAQCFTSNLVPPDMLQTGFNTKMLNTFKHALSHAFLLIDDSAQPRAEHMVLF